MNWETSKDLFDNIVEMNNNKISLIEEMKMAYKDFFKTAQAEQLVFKDYIWKIKNLPILYIYFSFILIIQGISKNFTARKVQGQTNGKVCSGN